MCAFACALCFLEPFFLSARASDGDTDGRSRASDALRDAFFALDETVELSEYSLSPEGLSEIFTEVIKNEPLLFYVSGTLSYTLDGDRVASAAPRYTMTREEIAAALARIDEWTGEILSGVCALYGDAQTAAYLYGEVCASMDYDRSLASADLYSAILCGKGTCQSYTAAYILLLRKCGIDACFAASDAMKHIWVLLELDGEWYHADPTWDDEDEGGYSLDYFLLSDASALASGHSDWYSPLDVECRSETYGDGELEELRERVSARGDGDHSGAVDLLDLAILRAQAAKEPGGDVGALDGTEDVTHTECDGKEHTHTECDGEDVTHTECDGEDVTVSSAECGESPVCACSACLDLNLDGKTDAQDARLLRLKLLSGD